MQYNFKNVLLQECMDEKGLIVNLPEPKCKLLDEKVPKKKRLWGEKLLAEISEIKPNPIRVAEIFEHFKRIVGPEWKNQKTPNHLIMGRKSDVVDFYWHSQNIMGGLSFVERYQINNTRKDKMDELVGQDHVKEEMRFDVKDWFDNYSIKVDCFESEKFIIDNFAIKVGCMREKGEYDDHRRLTTIFKKETEEYIILANNGHPMIECSKFRVLFSDGHGVELYHKCYGTWKETHNMICKYYSEWTRY